MNFRRSVAGALMFVAAPFACALDACVEFRADGPGGVVPGGDAADAADARIDDAVLDGSLGDALADSNIPDTNLPEDSPADFECPRWTKEPRDPNCSPRRIFVLEHGIAETTALRLAATPAGHIGIAYNTKLNAEEGQIHVIRFSGDAVSSTPLVIADGQFDNVGLSLDMASGPDQSFSLAYQTVPSGEISYRTLGPAGPPSGAELVAGGIVDPSSIALTVAPSGEVRATYSSPAQQSIFSKAKPRGETWQAASTVATYRDGDAGSGTTVPGAWQVSAVSDETGSTHAAFHAPRAGGRSEPRYTQFAGPLWNESKVLDNPAGLGTSGFSIALGLAGQTRYAAFYHRPVTATVAELLLASWTSVSMTPTIQRLASGIASENADAPRYRAAMAIDRWGLVHLVLAHPNSLGGGVIEYRRQARVSGQVTWLRDIIDDPVLSDISGDAMVAIAMSPNGRPHIAYYRAADGTMVYATRSDRQM